MSISYVIFDIAAGPEITRVLREEINVVTAEENPTNAWLQKSGLPKLRNLSSSM
jgi:hypothetical protein